MVADLKYGSFRTSYKAYLGAMRRSGSLERMHAYLTCGPENCFPSFLDHSWLPRSLLNGTWYVQNWCIGTPRSGPRQRPVLGTYVYFPVTRLILVFYTYSPYLDGFAFPYCTRSLFTS
jgi:hypothetical protein